MSQIPIKKILLMGLSNSGKTSILHSYQGVKNLPAFCSLKPTIQINRVLYQAVEPDCTIWDFGGQSALIKGYLEDFVKYLTGTSQIIYTIDIQDKKKYKPSFSYLKKIISIIMENKPEVKFSVFLHKCDPDLNQTHPEITDEVFVDLIKRIKELFLNSSLKYKICKTTIYAIFDKTEVDLD